MIYFLRHKETLIHFIKYLRIQQFTLLTFIYILYSLTYKMIDKDNNIVCYYNIINKAILKFPV